MSRLRLCPPPRSLTRLGASALLLASIAGAQPSYRQSTCLQPVNGTSATLEYPAPVAIGSLLVVAVTTQSDTSLVTSVTDTLGNLYRPAFPTVRGNFNHSHEIWYAPAAARGGANTVAVTVDEDVQIIVYAHEYTGFEGHAVLDTTSIAIGIGGLLDSGMVTLSAAPELLFAYAVSFATVSTAPPGFIGRETCSADMDADRVVLEGGSYNAAFEGSDGPWSSMLLTFRSETPDAGEQDGGSMDAGYADGGSPDGGADDNGPLVFQTCGCGSGGGPLLLAVLLMGAARRFSGSHLGERRARLS